MVIECKSTTAPWIAFFGGSADIWEGFFPYFMHGQRMDCSRCNDLNELYSLGPGGSAPIAYAITEKKSAKSDRDHAREAVLAVTSAATAKVHEAEQEFGDTRRGPAHYGYRILPLVVTKSPIASCSLGESGDVILSLIDSCWISTVHEMRDEPVRSLVINYTAFKTFITELAAIYGRLGIE